jgi:MFS family permease
VTARPGIRETWQAATTPARAILVGLLVHKLGAFVQVFLVLYLVEHRGMSNNHAGLALGVHGAGAIVGVLLGGWLSDRVGPRRTMVGSMVSSAVFTVALLYVSGLAAVLTTVFVVGVVSQAYRPAAASVLAAVVPQRSHTMVFAMYRLALNVGTTIAPLLAIALIAVSYDLLFWVEASVMLVYGAVVLVAVPGSTPSTGRPEPAPPSEGDGATDSVLADRRFVLFLVATFLNSAVYVQYLSALPLAVTANGMGTGVYGALVAVNGALVIGLELPITRITQGWPARVAAASGFALIGVGLAGYASPLGVAGFVVATVVWTFGEIVASPTTSAYPARASAAVLRGRYIASAQAAFGLGYAIGPLVGVALWSLAGDRLWLGCGAVGLTAAVAVWYGIRHQAAVQPAA